VLSDDIAILKKKAAAELTGLVVMPATKFKQFVKWMTHSWCCMYCEMYTQGVIGGHVVTRTV